MNPCFSITHVQFHPASNCHLQLIWWMFNISTIGMAFAYDWRSIRLSMCHHSPDDMLGLLWCHGRAFDKLDKIWKNNNGGGSFSLSKNPAKRHRIITCFYYMPTWVPKGQLTPPIFLNQYPVIVWILCSPHMKYIKRAINVLKDIQAYVCFTVVEKQHVSNLLAEFELQKERCFTMQSSC
jgi:hypothetical protein